MEWVFWWKKFAKTVKLVLIEFTNLGIFKMLMYLDVIAIACFVLFILLLIRRARRIRKTGNYSNAGRFTIFLSWLLLIVFFISISGIAYGATNPTGFDHLQTVAADQVAKVSHHHQSSAESQTKESSHTRPSQSTEPKKVIWSPETPQLKSGEARVTFTVPQSTTVMIKGHLHHQQYGKISADDHAKKSTIKFTYAGQYDVEINQDGVQHTATLTVK